MSLKIEAGSSVALVGPSGAGKSTLLLALAGLLRPSAGSVRFDGHDLSKMSDDERAQLRLREFGFVMQGGELMPELSLAQNVQVPLRLAGVKARTAASRAAEVLESLGIDTSTAARLPDEVSGGQAQRAAVARALVHAPRVVFADEPTGALDSSNGAAVMALLLEHSARVGAALVMVTHDRDLADQLGREVEVRDGRLREADHARPHGDLA